MEIMLQENIASPSEEKFIARIILFSRTCNNTLDQ